MTTAENISFTPSLYFRYTYTIRTAKGERKINVYKTSLTQKNILLTAFSALLYIPAFPACHSKNPQK